jgi:hypothetical protein
VHQNRPSASKNRMAGLLPDGQVCGQHVEQGEHAEGPEDTWVCLKIVYP